MCVCLIVYRAALAELASMEGGDAAGGGGGEELVSRLPATPHYNSSILEDLCMKDHLAALHGMCGDSEAFRDAIILGKVPVRWSFFGPARSFFFFFTFFLVRNFSGFSKNTCVWSVDSFGARFFFFCPHKREVSLSVPGPCRCVTRGGCSLYKYVKKEKKR